MKPKAERTPYMILAGFLCIWLCIALIVIPRIYGPVILLDEFGYWAHAAHMAGMDWKEVISRSGWYSFGYGILMLPFMNALSNPTALYRCMVGINFLLMGISTLLVYKILKEISDSMDRRLTAVISGVSMLYVAYITYAQTTMTEVLLTFLYVLLAYGLRKWFMRCDIWSGLLVMLTAGYMYMVHMRTIGIVLATAVCMETALIFRLRKEKQEKHKIIIAVLAIIILTALIPLVTGIIKESLIDAAASERYSDAAGVNGYSGQWEKLRYLCSLAGIYRFLTGMAGKVFYLGCASFGLYYWGMFFLLKRAKSLITCIIGKKDCTGEDWFYLWFLLSHAAAFLITGISWIHSGRLDGILYGRYHENTLPFILSFGIAELLTHPSVKKKTPYLAGLLGVGVVLVSILLDVDGIEYMSKCHITGIMYAIGFADRYAKRTLLFAYVFGLLGSIMVIELVRLTDGGRHRKYLLLGIGLMQLLSAFYAGWDYTIAANRNQKEDIELLCRVSRMIDAGGEDEALYLYGEKDLMLYLAQYMLQDVSLHPVSGEEVRDADRALFVIALNGDEMSEELSLYYTEMSESPHFKIYYNDPQ